MGLPARPASTLALLTALAIVPQVVIASPRLMPLLAQSPTVIASFPVPTSVPSGTTITVGSSSSLAGINEVIGQRFENQFSGTDVAITYSSSDEALASLANGQVDIAAIGRPLTDAEKAQGYTEVLLSRSKIALIVSEENPFAGEITTIGFSELFRGEITDWSEFEGGNSGSIRLVDRPASSDTRQALSQYPVFQAKPFQAAPNATSVDTDSTEAVIAALGTDGIGYAIADQALNRPGIRVLPMHKVLPTNPNYPFSQPLSYVYKGEASSAVQAFLGYAKSPLISDVVEEAKALGADATFGGLQGAPKLDPTTLIALIGTSTSPDGAVAPTPTGETSSGETNSSSGNGNTNAETSGTDGSGASGATPDPSDTASNGNGGDGAIIPENESTTQTDGSGETSAESGTSGPGADGIGTDVAVGSGDASNSTGSSNGDGAGTNSSVGNGAEGTETAIAPNDSQQNFSWWWIWLLGAPPLAALLWWLLKGKNREEDDVPPIAGVDPATIAPISDQSEQFDAPLNDQRPSRKISTQASFAESPASPSRQRGANSVSPITPIPDDPDLNLADTELSASDPSPDVRTRFLTADVDLSGTEASILDSELNIPDIEEDMPDFDTAILDPDIANDRELDIPPNIPGIAAAGAALAGVAAMGDAAVGAVTKEPKPTSQVIMVPRDSHSAYVYWEVSDEDITQGQKQGGKTFAVRLHDVTVQGETELPDPIQYVECAVEDCDRHLNIPAADREYVAEVGYLTEAQTWISLAQSASVQVTSDLSSITPNSDHDIEDAIAGATGVVGMAGVVKRVGDAIATPEQVSLSTSTTPSSNLATPTVRKKSRLILVPRMGDSAYAYWEVSDEKKAALRKKGGQKLALRLYDVTGINPRNQKPHGVRQFDCNEQDCDRHVTVPKKHRSYLADLGYTTKDGKWLRLAHSVPVQVPAMADPVPGNQEDPDPEGPDSEGDNPRPASSIIGDHLTIEDAPCPDNSIEDHPSMEMEVTTDDNAMDSPANNPVTMKVAFPPEHDSMEDDSIGRDLPFEMVSPSNNGAMDRSPFEAASLPKSDSVPTDNLSFEVTQISKTEPIGSELSFEEVPISGTESIENDLSFDVVQFSEPAATQNFEPEPIDSELSFEEVPISGTESIENDLSFDAVQFSEPAATQNSEPEPIDSELSFGEVPISEVEPIEKDLSFEATQISETGCETSFADAPFLDSEPRDGSPTVDAAFAEGESDAEAVVLPEAESIDNLSFEKALLSDNEPTDSTPSLEDVSFADTLPEDGNAASPTPGFDENPVSNVVDGVKAKANDVLQSGHNTLHNGQKSVGQTGQTMVDSVHSLVRPNNPQTDRSTAIILSPDRVSAESAETDETQPPVAEVIIAAYDVNTAYVSWEIPEPIITHLQRQGVTTLSLKIHEVTDINLDYCPAHSTQEVHCDIDDRDRVVPVPLSHKDYLAELGYVSNDGSWLRLGRSLHTRIPSA